jgi:asparagine synthase (glutamine-hydrolysing)
VIVFDGRIDNRQALLAVLKPQLASTPPAVSNEAIILAAYEKWGLDFPKHLIGDFAFALWDAKNHRLICARDHFGVKPFYYSLSKQSFVFASTPRALLASGKVPLLINEERIADHLVGSLEGVDKTSTFYKEIFRLPPAHILILQSGMLTIQRYWELHPVVHEGSKTEDDYVEAFQELFAESVRCQLRDVAIPASMLSGGMDSSAIVGIGRTVLAEEGLPLLHTISAISTIASKNRETANIMAVVNQGGLQPILVSETELIQRMDELIAVLEMEGEPFDCLMNLGRAVYLHAQDQGIGAILDGIQGDVLFSISGHLPQLWREGACQTIIGETLNAEGVIAEYKMGRNLFINSFLSAFTPFAPEWFRNLRRPIRYNNILRSAPNVRDTIIDRGFALRSRLGERFATLDANNPRLHSFNHVELHKNVLDQPFITTGLERYERVASAFGIEARHPFHDVRLVEFCLGLPWQLQTYHGWTKFIMRRALEPYLPSEVIWRRDKDSLMWEFNRIILKERADYFHQATLDGRENLKPYIDVGKLENFWHEYLTLGDEKHAEMLWSGVALAFWLRRQRGMDTKPGSTA